MKKINVKGFTLIELLAVITIMGILLFAGIPLVSRIIFNSRKDTSEVSVKSYTNEVNNEIKSQEIDNNIIDDGKYSIMKNGNLCLSTEYDKESDTCYVDVLEVDMEGSTPEGGEVEIINHKVAGVYNVEINKFYVNSEEDNYIASSDPVIPKNTICQTTGKVSYATGTLYKCEVAEGIFYDFRILNVSDDTVNLMMTKNLVDNVAYFDWGTGQGNSTSKCGPVTAYRVLNNATSSWDKLNNVVYKYKYYFEKKGIVTSTWMSISLSETSVINASHKYSRDNKTGEMKHLCSDYMGLYGNVKARLPELSEIEALGSATWYREGIGYWLNDPCNKNSSNEDISSRARAINGYYGDYHDAISADGIGIRPVIQVTKADLS